MAQTKSRAVVRRELLAFVTAHESTIVNALNDALNVYARHMDESAAGAQAAFEAGHSDGLITNQGYEQSANLFQQSAEKARQVAADLEAKVQAYLDADD